MIKPYAQACDRNRDPILSVLKSLLRDPGSVLEIGSGTGQHAVHFAEHLPHLKWKCTDLSENLPGMKQWVREAGLANLALPFELDVSSVDWETLEFDYVFSANVVHIMSWEHVEDFIKGAGRTLPVNGLFVLYGPFNYQGEYTSDSNQTFDVWLKDRDPLSGIRNFEDLEQLANSVGLEFSENFSMPANNEILCWQKQ